MLAGRTVGYFLGERTAGVDEANSLRETCGTKGGEVVDCGEKYGTASRRRNGIVDELESVVGRIRRVWEENCLTSRLGLRKQKRVALCCELRGCESIHSIRIDLAFQQRIHIIESFVHFGFASFDRLRFLNCHRTGH